MQVRKRTLYVVCPIILVGVVLFFIRYHRIQNEKAEERDLMELQATFDKESDIEYNRLIREYESIVETIKDNDYSYEFRYRYIIKLNELLGQQRYLITGIALRDVDNCITYLLINESEDKEILRQQAYTSTVIRFGVVK